MAPAAKLLLASWVAASVVEGGGLLENRAWAWALEVPRLLASLGLLVALGWGQPWLPVAAGAAAVVVLGALLWFYKLRPAGLATASAAGATS